MLLQFLADNVDYSDYMKGLDALSYDQLVILVERVIQNIKKQQKNTDTVKELIEKHFPIKSGTSEYSQRSQSEIECCLHCGSIAIKKHGTTRAGIQRYICKDCGKSFSANYGLITHYSHLSDWQWREIIRGTVEGLSLTEIAKNINVSVSTAWSCRLKVYQTLKNIYGHTDTFNNIVEADGTYIRVSFKGKKDKKFFMMPKFRSMRTDAPANMPTHLLNDPEVWITPVGKFLRKRNSRQVIPHHIARYWCGCLCLSSSAVYQSPFEGQATAPTLLYIKVKFFYGS